ncbi:hypothetical protein ACI65C_009352 [Semiaphis heraclei]
MSFWKIFVIFFSVASIWLDRCGCAPYNYFGVESVVNSDVRQALPKSGSLITLAKKVSEIKPTTNIPTRGLFYPDDMFYTNWVPNTLNAEICSGKNAPVTTPSDSISKCTLKAINNDKPTKYQTTLGQKKSTNGKQNSNFVMPASSTIRKRMSTLVVQKSTSDISKPKLAVTSPLSEQYMSTYDVQSSTSRKRKWNFASHSSRTHQRMSTLGAQRSSSGQRMSPSHSSSNHRQKSTFDVERTSSGIRKSKLAVTSPSIGSKKSSTHDGRSSTNHKHNSNFAVSSSTVRQKMSTLAAVRKSSSGQSFVKSSWSHRRKSTFDVEISSRRQRKLMHSLKTTTDYIITPDLDYFITDGEDVRSGEVL